MIPRDFGTMAVMQWYRAVIPLIAAIALGCASVSQNSQPIRFLARGFSVAVPADVVVESSQMIDWDAYTFTLRGRKIVGAILSPTALYGTYSPSDVPEKSLVLNELEATCGAWINARSGGLGRECLVILDPSASSFASRVLFHYSGLTEEASRVADAIIDSVRPEPSESR